ncbi:hypothetical protein K491DRAFT_436777 [Lophiostoma macrostomum CBS 122681]|uniref:Uncharacterized protein n=1 Tax=Lophiostoma macrostomum CBS 122681 TaxID=1314788 RepID=A0A6A6T7C6_9PLEO|nr:hypothetical protein K491DRAFT_436777 [Lophiostoma macrostomum CBS 122681]
MSLIYGEGKQKASIRLRKEITESLMDGLPALTLRWKYDGSPASQTRETLFCQSAIKLNVARKSYGTVDVGNRGAWDGHEGSYLLSMDDSGTSGMLRFNSSSGEMFCLVVGFRRWCDIVVDLDDDDTAEKIHPTYHAKPISEATYRYYKNHERGYDTKDHQLLRKGWL